MLRTFWRTMEPKKMESAMNMEKQYDIIDGMDCDGLNPYGGWFG